MPSEARSIRGGAKGREPAHPPVHPEGRSAGSGLVHAWGALDRDRRLAAIAAAALFATMFLPWYQQNAVVSAAKTAPLVSRNLNAFAVFSFVEAAVLLVAVAVLFLLYTRAEGREFHLPGGDGTVVLAAGLWSALLLVLRLFDKPGITQHGVAANVGIQWGIFFALAAAGLLAYAGSRMRTAQRPGAPLVRRGGRDPIAGHPREPAEPEWDTPAATATARPSQRPREPVEPEWDTPPATATARAPRRPREPVEPEWDTPPATATARPSQRPREPVEPEWEDPPLAHADEEATAVIPRQGPATAAARAQRRPRGPATASTEQLSFEDPHPDADR